MTLNNLERRNRPLLSVISPNSVAFGAHYVKVVKDTPIGPTFCGRSVAQRI